MSGTPSFQLGKLLILGGIVLVGLGLLIMASGKFPSSGLGHLPGDISYKGKHVHVYIPIVSCLIVSAALTAVLWIISFFSKK